MFQLLDYPDQSTAHLVGYVSGKSKRPSKKQYLKDMSVGIAAGKTGLENKLDKDIIGKVDFNV